MSDTTPAGRAPRTYLAVVQKAGAGCRVDMPEGSQIALEGTRLDCERSTTRAVCMNALQDVIPAVRRMDVLLARNELPPPGERVLCTECPDAREAAEFELVYLPYGFDGDPDDDPEMVRLIAALKTFEVMAPLPSSTIERIAHMFRRVEVPAGEAVIEQGQEGEALYLVWSGELSVTITDRAGEETEVATVGTGACLGEMALLTGQTASATVRAKTAATLLTLEGRAFNTLLVHNPGMNVYFAQLLVERIQHNQKLLAKEVTSGMAGELSTMSPSQLLQALNATHSSGRVTLVSGSREVVLTFVTGDVHRVEPRRGMVDDPEEAVYDLLGWTEGTFAFEATEGEIERTFFKNLLALMLEGTRRFDEKRLRASLEADD